jgi:hypothetical protein
MTLKIHGGTAPGSSDSLCYSCRHATIIRGARLSEEVIECSRTYAATRVTFAVKTCSEYSDRTTPSRSDMEDIAWILRTDAKRNVVGFVRPGGSRIPVVSRYED